VPKVKEHIYALDTEATGLDLRHGARPFFVSICTQDNEVHYWEATVDPLTRRPYWKEEDLYEIQEMIDEADTLVLQNPRYDFRGLDLLGLRAGTPRNWIKVRDTLMAGHLLVSNQPHDLTTMAMIYLRLNIQPLEDKLEAAVKEAVRIAKRKYPKWRLAKKDLPEMPSAKDKVWKYDSWLPKAIAAAEGYEPDHDWWTVLANYGNGDSSVTLPLYLAQEKLLIKAGLYSIYKFRLKLLPTIYKMETHGMTMSKERTTELLARLTDESEQCRANCIELSDGELEDLPVNGMSNALRHVLFEKFSLHSPKQTAAGKSSADKFVLDHWIATLPESSRAWKFVNDLKRYRKRKTAIGYIHSYEKFWQHTVVTLRGSGTVMIVYPSYNPTGTDTLRFSSQNPNAQQVSKQEEVNTRYCFGPAPGREWWSIDFSNLELRIPAYESGEEEMIFLFEHPNDPPYYGSYHMMIFDTLHPNLFLEHGMECKKVFESTWYQWTKNGNFAVQYGAVEHSGTADKAYHVLGAQRKIMSRFTRIKQLSNRWIEFANKSGYVETMPDKTVDPIRGYPLYCTRTNYGKVLETVPLSYHVQGTAMWITCRAMIDCQNYLDIHKSSGGRIISQIHDEILFDFPVGVGKHHVGNLRKLMEQVGQDIGVPLATTCGYHPVTWAKSENYQ
jgi:DNA polymerase I-like protein with 3'-5' exonuclease and polymerase domains